MCADEMLISHDKYCVVRFEVHKTKLVDHKVGHTERSFDTVLKYSFTHE